MKMNKKRINADMGRFIVLGCNPIHRGRVVPSGLPFKEWTRDFSFPFDFNINRLPSCCVHALPNDKREN